MKRKSSPSTSSLVTTTIRRRRQRAFLFLMSVCFIFSLWQGWVPTLIPVSRVEVTGNDQVSTVAIRHLADVRLGSSLLTQDLTAIQHRVEKHPLVRSANITRRLSGAIQITLIEEGTLFLLAHQGLYRVSSDGRVFAKARGSFLDYPILTGLEPEWVEQEPHFSGHLLKEAAFIMDELRVVMGDLSAISELHFDPLLGFVAKLEEGLQVVLGFDAYQSKIRRWKHVADQNIDLNDYKTLDLDLMNLALLSPSALSDYDGPLPLEQDSGWDTGLDLDEAEENSEESPSDEQAAEP